MPIFLKNIFKPLPQLSILVPYRDRKTHLAKFIPHIKEFFSQYHPRLPFQIYVIEQVPGKLFNRGKLMNIGYSIAKKNCDYISIHDVDMLPEEKCCNYSYCSYPTQLATYISRWDYRLVVGNLDVRKSCWGGVSIVPNDCYEMVNGFSNDYWGWGPEDQDFYHRCITNGLPFKRRDGRYYCLDHERADGKSPDVLENYRRFKMRENSKSIAKEGLSNLEYKTLDEITLEPDVFLITVEV